MTTAPSRPTPLDIANRDLDRALASGIVHLPANEPFRLLWEEGIRRSNLITNHRLIALALATHADYDTGDIDHRRQPFLDGLAVETQLGRGQVSVALKTLEQRGWIRRAGSRAKYLAYERCPWRLAIPALLLPRLRGK
jgi:hypothetical protein